MKYNTSHINNNLYNHHVTRWLNSSFTKSMSSIKITQFRKLIRYKHQKAEICCFMRNVTRINLCKNEVVYTDWPLCQCQVKDLYCSVYNIILYHWFSHNKVVTNSYICYLYIGTCTESHIKGISYTLCLKLYIWNLGGYFKQWLYFCYKFSSL